MAVSTNVLQATITATDGSGNTSVNRGLGNPTLAGVLGDFTISRSVAVGTVSLYNGTGAFNIYIKNNANPGSGITVQPVLTPSGGAAQTLATLQPGGVLLIWNVVNSVAASGYSDVSVTIAGGAADIEFFIGA